ncbi:MAG: adenylate kinase [Bacteroidales bacterium]
MINIVLFGPPGAGKGTQSRKIIEKYQLTHISTGEILRKAIAAKTPLGIEAQKHIDKGYYVPDEMAIDIVKKELKEYPHSKGFIFDGFPRTVNQANKLAEIVDAIGGKINVMISLEVDDDVLIDRLTNRFSDTKRIDDKDTGVIKKRIGIYNDRTKILKDYYKLIGKHEPVCGIGKIDVIFDKICSVIERYK